jgi:subtilisin
MSNLVDLQLQARGIAQIMVIFKSTSAVVAERPSAALAASIPVERSRSNRTVPQSLVDQLAKNFRFSEASPDTAMAASMVHRKLQSAGTRWYKRAAVASDPTPPVRYYPNLGLMFGTVDQTGLNALRANKQVEHVVSAPPLRLIAPVRVRPVADSAAAAAVRTWGIKRLKVDQLHGQGVTGEGVVVGHLDTGADGTHPALKGAFHAFAEFDDMGFQVTPSPSPHDTAEHGTHTAGTIAGRDAGGRSIGVAPQATLASAIVIEGGNVIARVLAGMDWAIGQGVHVLSMSLGLPGYTDSFLPLTQLLRQKGVLPVFAVGNEGPGTSRSPGNYEEALSVGAMDENDRVASFSSSEKFASWSVPDLVAPGVGVISAKPGGGYQQMDGTSMATPHIAGLAALLMQVAPTATINQIESAIFDSCTLLPGDLIERQGKGIPDAVKALELIRAVSSSSSTATPAAATPSQPKKLAKRKAPAHKRAPRKSRPRMKH